MTVVEGGKRFDSEAGRFEPNVNLVFDEGSILALDAETPPAESRIDARGKTILPGLMNLHGHLAWDGFSDLEKQTRFDGPTDAGDWAALAVRAGVDCIEHGGNYSDELIEEIRNRGIWIVPTLSPVVLQAREGHAWGMKESVILRRKKQLKDSGRHDGLVRARKAGVRLAFGTDSGSPVVPHDALLAEMEALLEFGIFEQPEEVLQAATFWAAECLRIQDKTGSLRAGKQADVVVLDGDLESDLSVVTRVEQVFVRGRHVVRDGAARLPDPRDFQTFAAVGA